MALLHFYTNKDTGDNSIPTGLRHTPIIRRFGMVMDTSRLWLRVRDLNPYAITRAFLSREAYLPILATLNIGSA